MSAGFTLGALLYAADLKSRLPPGDPDDHRELVGRMMSWFSYSAFSSFGGLLLMSVTSFTVEAGVRRKPRWIAARSLLLLAQMTPWIALTAKLWLGVRK